MKTVLNILTLGLYSLLSKRKSLKTSANKTKYRKDGTIKKTTSSSVDYSEDEGKDNLPYSKLV